MDEASNTVLKIVKIQCLAIAKANLNTPRCAGCYEVGDTVGTWVAKFPVLHLDSAKRVISDSLRAAESAAKYHVW